MVGPTEHLLSMTANFGRYAVMEISTKLQVSQDGRQIHWSGGSKGTGLSHDNSEEYSQMDSVSEVVLAEYRLMKPLRPCRLRAMRQAEAVLRVTDPVGSAGSQENAKLSPSRTLQCIIVGLAVILAKMMLLMPSTRELQAE